MNGAGDPEREQALEDYKKSLLELREWEAKLKSLRMGIKDLQREFDISEENIKALQSVGQIIGEVLKQLDEERCKSIDAPLEFSSASSLGLSVACPLAPGWEALHLVKRRIDLRHANADPDQSVSRQRPVPDMLSVATPRSIERS